MAITLTHTASSTSITLPDALSWADEFTWSPVVQNKTYTTTGALLIEEATRQAGRPITLEGTIDRTWCTRALVNQLRAWAAVPGMTLQLVLRATPRTVAFDHEKGALQGLPVLFYADSAVDNTDFYVPTLRLIEI